MSLPAVPEKLKSRKFWIAAVLATVLFLKDQFPASALVASIYLIAQTVLDAKK